MTLDTLKHRILPHRGVLVLLGLFLGTLGFVFQDALVATVEAWEQEEYSHGYIVPLIVFVLLLNKMGGIQAKPRASWLGFGLMTACIVLQFLFTLAGVHGVQSLLLVAFLLSFFILTYGVRFSKGLAGILGFLFFLAPLPKFFYYTISFNMQIVSTTLGTWLLQAVGISVFQEGNIIDLGASQLQVVEACNGLRYLFPLMALGYLLALMYKASFVKRAILFLSTIPITIGMNSLRLMLIGITVDRWGPEMAEGLLHDFEGWIVFVGCIIVLMIETALMQKIGKKGELDFNLLKAPSKKDLAAIPAPVSGRPFFAAIVVFFGAITAQAGITTTGWDEIRPVPLARPLTAFPMQLGDWIGRMGSMDEKALKVLGTEDYLIADYTNPAGESVNLYILYFPKQDSTSNQGIHSPAVCIPAGGWEIESKDLKTIQLDSNKSLTVNRMIISKGAQKELVYYWFIQGETEFWNLDLLKFIQAKNAIQTQTTNGALIRITTAIPERKKLDEAEATLLSFLAQNQAKLMSYL